MTVPVFKSGGSRVTLRVFVQPGASRTAICGIHDDAVKVRIAAPPEKGAANQALSAYLAEKTGVRKSSVRIVRGTNSRRKTVQIDGVTADDIRCALDLEEDG